MTHHRRSYMRGKMAAAVTAVAVTTGGMGILTPANAATAGISPAAGGQTIVCPPVADRLGAVPAAAQAEVNRNLALLEQQIADANRRLANSVGQGGPNFVQNAILGPLRSKRIATLERIAIAIGRTGFPRPQGLEELADCTLTGGNGQGQGNNGQGNGFNNGQHNGFGKGKNKGNNGNNNGNNGQDNGQNNGNNGQDNGQGNNGNNGINDPGNRNNGNNGQGNDNGQNNGNNGQDNGQGNNGNNNNGNNGQGNDNGQGNGNNGNNGNNNGNNINGNPPSRADFVDIRTVRPNVVRPRFQRNGSRGTFTSFCGRNERRHYNSDNVIVAPGVSNGAHHVHDYVGNTDTNGQSTNESLEAAGTTCTNGDKSAYFWPVLRLVGTKDFDHNQPGGGLDGNVGRILRPTSVTLTFRGNPRSKVVAPPKFLRIITGDAKSFTNGTANANSFWTCTGFENRKLTDKYPLCPRGSQVVRIFEFQSCWDGQNIDSANHRTHVAFARPDGTCPDGFQPIPQLVQRITYSVPPGPSYALDSFPEQLHKPITDHSDFINVMPERLMQRAVNCINSGRRCF